MEWLRKHAALYTIEAHCVMTAILLGLWMVAWCPISSSPSSPTLRGLHLLNQVFEVFPCRSDYIWGPLLFVPAALQTWLMVLGVRSYRARLATFQAMLFSFITILIGTMNIGSTGVPTYAMLTVANLFVMSQLIQAKYGLKDCSFDALVVQITKAVHE